MKNKKNEKKLDKIMNVVFFVMSGMLCMGTFILIGILNAFLSEMPPDAAVTVELFKTTLMLIGVIILSAYLAINSFSVAWNEEIENENKR